MIQAEVRLRRRRRRGEFKKGVHHCGFSCPVTTAQIFLYIDTKNEKFLNFWRICSVTVEKLFSRIERRFLVEGNFLCSLFFSIYSYALLSKNYRLTHTTSNLIFLSHDIAYKRSETVHAGDSVLYTFNMFVISVCFMVMKYILSQKRVVSERFAQTAGTLLHAGDSFSGFSIPQTSPYT